MEVLEHKWINVTSYFLNGYAKDYWETGKPKFQHSESAWSAFLEEPRVEFNYVHSQR